ncbi:MAG TPA: CapA family protein, partial [Acidimicrobiia bacterium]
MALTVALAGDTMLGRSVADVISAQGPAGLFSSEVKEVTRSADLFVLNLECCISEGGVPWPDPRKPFFFRAPPQAVESLLDLGVDCVTLANNHALDFGADALVDTLDLLEQAGIAVAGAGLNREAARRPVFLEHRGFRLGVVGLTDHPSSFEAGPGPGVAFADLSTGSVPL